MAPEILDKPTHGKVTVLPEDEHNKKLVGNVHPPDWTNPTPEGKYNIVVIGAGTAGLISAIGTAGLGGKSALIEKHLMGGDCLNVGCVPSKGLIRAARAAAEVRDAAELGVDVPPGAKANFPKIMERMRQLRARISNNDSATRYTKEGVDVYIGEAKFLDRETIEVEGKKLKFQKAVIACGARAAEIPIPGLKEAGYLTNETIFSLTELPKRFCVIGSGPIGSEMAQSFARFGSEVYLLEKTNRILPREDADASKVIEEAFAKDGVKLIKECNIVKIENRGQEKIVHFGCKEGTKQIVVDQILVGIGRQPNVEGLNLEAAGVEYDKRAGVKVNDHLQTSNPNVYAAGDICFPYKFTHTAEAMAGIVIQNALFKGRAKASSLVIPWCTYTQPEIAHVGAYEQELEKKGVEFDTFVHPLADIDRAILDGEDEGFIKVHADKKGFILGATIVAGHAGEMISEVTLAMTAKVKLSTIASTIHPYPTQAECIKRIGGKYRKSKLTPFVKGLFTKWLAWGRR